MKKILPIALSLVMSVSAVIPAFAEESNNNTTTATETVVEENKVVEEKKLVPVNFNLTVNRISGENRYLTAVQISKEYFKTSDIVVLASGKQYIDALVGGSLVSQIKVPLLLTDKDKISKDVLNEIKRLKSKNVIILGGNNTVSQSVEKEISKLGISVERLSGENRYATAQKIAYSRYYLHSKNTNNAMGERFVGIDSKNYPDALIASAIVGQIDGSTLSYIMPNPSKLILSRPYWLVFGGTNSIPTGPSETKRISGEDRYATSVNGARAFEDLTGKKLKTIILADGRNYPDALAASSIAGMEGATVLLTRNNKLPDVVLNYIKEGAIEKVVIVGGDNSVNNSIEKELKGLSLTKYVEETANK